MSQRKEAFYDKFVYQTSRCLHKGNEKKTEVEICIYIHMSYQKFTLYGLNQNLVNFDHFEINCKSKALFKIVQ